MFEGAYDMSLFITFEGGEGSGKTTIAKMLHKQFIEEGYNITFSREPGDRGDGGAFAQPLHQRDRKSVV